MASDRTFLRTPDPNELHALLASGSISHVGYEVPGGSDPLQYLKISLVFDNKFELEISANKFDPGALVIDSAQFFHAGEDSQ